MVENYSFCLNSTLSRHCAQMVVGRWNGRLGHVRMQLAVRERNQVDPDGDLWMSVLEATGQPHVIGQRAQ